jgi:hypothetical protein
VSVFVADNEDTGESLRTRYLLVEQSRRKFSGDLERRPDGHLGLPRVVGCEDTLSTAAILWGLLFGSLGLGFFLYGKKQRAVVPLVCGLVLMVFPYFISSTTLLLVVGIVVTAIPYFVRI